MTNNIERAILVATQFFRFWKYEWTDLSKEHHSTNNYVPNSDDISRLYEELENNALESAKKNKNKVGEAECGYLFVTCIIYDDGPYFEYYISAS